MFKVITKKVFKGTDEKNRQVLKAIVWHEEEKAEVEGIISYRGEQGLLTVTTPTLFKIMILKLESKSLQAAYNAYTEAQD